MTVADPPPVVDPDTVARRLGLALPMSADTAWLVTQAILDAQADVEAYLNRPLSPTEYVESGLWPASDGSWGLCNTPLVAIVSSVPDTDPDTGRPTGTWTVTYTAGLDTANDPLLAPIRRYVTAAAMNSQSLIDLWRAVRSDGGLRVKSLSTEGQSVSYSDQTPLGPAGAGLPGSLPPISSLDRWKRRSVYQRRSALFDGAYWTG